MRDFKEAFDAAREHARAEFPKESCGFVVDGAYIACENIAGPISTHQDDTNCHCQLCSFKIADAVYLRHAADIEMILHSHPNGPLFPSEADMRGQIASGVVWGIIPLNDEITGAPILWGDGLGIQPVIGRNFVHGVTDCYTLARDVFALGREALNAQDVTGWPFDPIKLPEYPRNDSWWLEPDKDLYNTEAFKLGFVEISMNNARPGDCFLSKIHSDKFNHAGVLLDSGLILHHLPTRLSRREPAGIWARQAGRWLRYVGVPQ